MVSTQAGAARPRGRNGTVGYMAPEVCAGGARQTPAVDFFSLGCVLYELLYGRCPFRGSAAKEFRGGDDKKENMMLATRFMDPTFEAKVEPAAPAEPKDAAAKKLDDDDDDGDAEDDGEPPFEPSEPARDLVRALLAKDPARRLGSMAGALEVLAHGWFQLPEYLAAVEADAAAPPVAPKAAVNSDMWSNIERDNTLSSTLASAVKDARAKGKLAAAYDDWDFVHGAAFDADVVEFLRADKARPFDYEFANADEDAVAWDDSLRDHRSETCAIS